MAGKPDLDYGNDRYSEEETAKRLDATIRAMIAMPPRPAIIACLGLPSAARVIRQARHELRERLTFSGVPAE